MTETDEFEERWTAQQEREEQQRAAARALLVADLRAAGVTRAELFYEGYNDDGNIEDTVLLPSDICIGAELRARLEDFAWDFAYSYNPGLEIDCGGHGELIWDLNKDSIDLSYQLHDEATQLEVYRGQ